MREIRRNLLGFLVFIWVAGLIISLAVGLGLRFGSYGWRRHLFSPGEEVILATGKNEGLFCETLMLESSGYITGQNALVRDWLTFEKLEVKVDHLDVRLSDRYYDFRRYRLYTKDWLDVYICTEYGLTIHVATSVNAFIQLKSAIEQGRPCTDTPSASDPFCGKVVKTYRIERTERCEWTSNGAAGNNWRRVYYSADIPTDVFIVMTSNPLENRWKNLVEIVNNGKTYRSTASMDIVSECIQQQMCMFGFDFSADQAVVVQIGTENEDPTAVVEIWTYCQSRDWFFVLLFCICPIVLLSATSFCVVRKFAPRHNLAYV